MSSILESAIATVYVFLLLSLVVTALNELIASYFDQRASFLKLALEEIINTKGSRESYDPKSDPSPVTVTKILQHGLVTSLSKGPYEETNKGGNGVPSYIPAEIFSSALISLLGDGTKAELQKNIDKITPNSRLRSSLQAIFDETGGELALFRKNVERWFDEAMTRTSGWYKRSAQRTMFFLALGLAVFCNVDTLRIIKEVSTNDSLRRSLILASEARIATGMESGKKTDPLIGDEAWLKAKRMDIETALGGISSTGIPIGWKSTGLLNIAKELIETLPTALIGWLMTACAASMGAPFWFDTLGRFMNVRSAGRAPGEKENITARPTFANIDPPPGAK